MQKYQNETFTKGSSTFIAIDPVSGQRVEFRSARKAFTNNGVNLKATNASVRLVVPTEVAAACDPCSIALADSSIEIKFNLVDGADFAALKSEVDRLLMAAVDLSLLDGVVPNPVANLDQE